MSRLPVFASGVVCCVVRSPVLFCSVPCWRWRGVYLAWCCRVSLCCSVWCGVGCSSVFFPRELCFAVCGAVRSSVLRGARCAGVRCAALGCGVVFRSVLRRVALCAVALCGGVAWSLGWGVCLLVSLALSFFSFLCVLLMVLSFSSRPCFLVFFSRNRLALPGSVVLCPLSRRPPRPPPYDR